MPPPFGAKGRLLGSATSYGCATIQKAPLGSKGAHENNRRGRFFSFHLPPTVERRFAICPRRSFPCLAAFHGCTKWEFTSLCACGALPLILSFPVQALRSYNSMPFFYLYIRPLPHAGFFRMPYNGCETLPRTFHGFSPPCPFARLANVHIRKGTMACAFSNKQSLFMHPLHTTTIHFA